MISEKFEDATNHHSTLTEELQHEISTAYKVKLTPSVEQAKLSKQPPTDGEIYLLEYLEKNLDCESEVYFQPCFNGDRPDVVIVKKGVGIVIVEVKDWDLKHYYINNKNQWHLKHNNVVIKSPYAQVFSYKKNMFEIHVNGLLEKKMKNENFYKLISVYVYFHNANRQDISELYSREISAIDKQILEANVAYINKAIDFKEYKINIEKLESKKNKFTRNQNVLTVTRDSLKKISFHNKDKNELFSESVYLEFIRLLKPPIHYANQGKHIAYTKNQIRLSKSASGDRVKIRGLAGSGKTTVLAMRAVNAHKRHGGAVLILTYNLTLCMYIKDKISEVREEFSWSYFEIINYHKFMTFALNDAGIEIEIDEGEENSESQLDAKYYSNTNVFSDSNILRKYDTILIDEVQDYKSEWLTIIKDNFLAKNGEMVIFGDEKQNIYDRTVDEEKKVRVSREFGKWKILSRSFRYKPDSRIKILTSAFQYAFLSKNYELDTDESPQASIPILGVNAIGFYEEDCLEPIARKIIDIAKKFSIHPNDIAILSSQEKTLKKLDHIIRTGDYHKERTITTFESIEVSRHETYSKDSRKVSNAKKIGFNLNSGVMKLSTIHSFKGYESPNIFLFINDKDSPEIVYTGLTRAKENIVVFIKQGSKYADFFQERLDNIETYLPN